MFRRLVPAVVACILAAQLAAPAFADGEWCENEPDLVLPDGTTVQVTTQVQTTDLHLLATEKFEAPLGTQLVPGAQQFPEVDALATHRGVSTVSGAIRVVSTDGMQRGAPVRVVVQRGTDAPITLDGTVDGGPITFSLPA